MTTAAVVAYYSQEGEAKVLTPGTPLFYIDGQTKRPGLLLDRRGAKV